MRTEIICESKSLYRDDFQVKGYVFGTGKKSLCIVGNMRGNEYQQLYTCSQMIQWLSHAEREDTLTPGHEIMVIPSANPYSMNTKKRFWPNDNTDINRMFPGYALGETTQRIAADIFSVIQHYDYGIQLASNYLSGEFMPYVNVMTTGHEDVEMAKKFGLPYVVIRNSRPYDTTTLNYNWQIWETKAFSLYTTTTERINKMSAMRGVKAMFSFMAAAGLVRYGGSDEAVVSRVVDDREIISVRTPEAGLFEPVVSVEQEVEKGKLLARILNPVDGEVLARIYAPADGTVFFIDSGPLTYGHTAVIKMIPEKS